MNSKLTITLQAIGLAFCGIVYALAILGFLAAV
jgi:hypothetical protein